MIFADHSYEILQLAANVVFHVYMTKASKVTSLDHDLCLEWLKTTCQEQLALVPLTFENCHLIFSIKL